MHVHSRRLSVVLALLLIFPVAQAFAADKDDNYDDTIKVFKAAGESGKYFVKSYGYAVFPTIGEGAVGIGGAHGDGRVYQAAGHYVGETEMSQVSVGLQLGGKSYSQIIFFEDKHAFNLFTSGKFEFGAEAQAVLITAAASAEGSTGGSSASASAGKQDAKTAGGYTKGMATFQVTKGGLMGGVNIGGQKFSFKAKK